MGWNTKSIRMNKNRAGIERSFLCPFPKLEVTFGLVNQWLANPMLSYKNCLRAAKWVVRMRDMECWKDIESQKQINYLDDRVAQAKERVKKRDERRAAKKVEVLGIKKPVGRPSKKNEPTPPTPTAEDPSEVWKRALAEQEIKP